MKNPDFGFMTMYEDKTKIRNEADVEEPKTKKFKRSDSNNSNTNSSYEKSSDSSYETLVSLLLGSISINYWSQTQTRPSLTFNDPSKKEDDSAERLVGDTMNVNNTKPFVLQQTFSALRNQPLGSIPSITFWNQDQLRTLHHMDSNPHNILLVCNN